MELPRVSGSAVMVTGGCGFIGSHLVRLLLERGARRVVVLDDMRHGARANVERAGEVELVEHTLGSGPSRAIAEAMRGVDSVFHFAAEKHGQASPDSRRILCSNVDGTYDLLEAAARAGVRKVVFASSLYVYGRTSGAPFVEDEVPRPTTVYGISKLAGEHLLAHRDRESGLPYNVLRLLFVYGPRQHPGTGYKSVIVANFERLLRGEPPVIRGDGRQALDYVYVEDAVEAAILALESPLEREVFNIGRGAALTIDELTALMQSVAGTALPARSEPPDWTAGTSRVGNIEKARRLLGWQPRTGMREGLARTFAWLAAEPAGERR
jgi:UDP-glucose 4-epimerase